MVRVAQCRRSPQSGIISIVRQASLGGTLLLSHVRVAIILKRKAAAIGRSEQSSSGWCKRKSAMGEVEDFRAEIHRLDGRILELIRERINVAVRIGELKKERGLALRDWKVERAVLEHAERTGRQLGVSPMLTRGVMQLLLAGSRVEQERQTFSAYSGEAESILIIGGAGKMGRWFADFFSDQGHSVSVYDVVTPVSPAQRPRSLEASLPQTTVAVIATPLETVGIVVDRLAAAEYPGVVFDIASLKSHFKGAIARARAAGLSLTSVHPMFGPATRTLSDQVICICDCGDVQATARARAFFADTAATLVDLPLDEHDRIVSYVLGLSHLVNILFARVLMAGGDSLETLNRVGSTTFHSQMSTSAGVVQENPDLYYAIQSLNDFTPRLYESIFRELSTLTNAVLNGDRTAFTGMMQAARRWVTGEAGA